jgi:hypothetical protein
MAGTDAYSTAVCRLFLNVPESVTEPIEMNQYVRDTHWYIGQVLDVWYEDRRGREGSGFRRMPWYREKALCGRVAGAVRGRAQRTIANATGVYGISHKDRLWDLVEEALGVEARKEYEEYQRKLAKAEQVIQKLSQQAGGR